MKKFVIAFSLFLAAFPVQALAHCPLCTAGAGALAVAAQWAGVDTVIVGVFLGAFAMALGFWMTKLVKRQYIPYQRPIIILAVFFSTLLPLLPLAEHYTSIYLPFWGLYGKTIIINRFILGSIAGGLLLIFAPSVSSVLTGIRGSKFPYQTMAVTFAILIIASFALLFIV